MTKDCEAVIGIFATHAQAEEAVKRLADAKFDIDKLSIVGKGYELEEKVVGFYSAEKRIRLWGKNGALWGGLWGLFFSGIFMTIPVVGHLVVLGHLSTMLAAAAGGAAVVGGLSALGAALVSLGIPKDSVLEYEAAVRVDRYLVVAHGTPEEATRARVLMHESQPLRLDTHPIPEPRRAAEHATHAHV